MRGWNHRRTGVLFFLCITFFCSGLIQAQNLDDDLLSDDLMESENQISDPLEPINRAFFQFNDKLYFWVLKPVSTTYASMLPEDVRMCIGNAYKNLLAPVRIVNNFLQGKVTDTGTELARFVINTIAGAGGLGDPAQDVFNLKPKTEDLGQTIGKWGFGEGIYICWPIFGPSNVRDTVGLVGDAFLNPLTYLTMSSEKAGYSAQVGRKVNSTSLTIGDYEQFKEASLDPYGAMRDFYYQSRRSKIADKVRQGRDFSGKEIPNSFIPASKESALAWDVPQKAGKVDDVSPVHALVDLNNIEKMIGHTYFTGDYEDFDARVSLERKNRDTDASPKIRSLIAGLNSAKDIERL